MRSGSVVQKVFFELLKSLFDHDTTHDDQVVSFFLDCRWWEDLTDRHLLMLAEHSYQVLLVWELPGLIATILLFFRFIWWSVNSLQLTIAKAATEKLLKVWGFSLVMLALIFTCLVNQLKSEWVSLFLVYLPACVWLKMEIDSVQLFLLHNSLAHPITT
jgi:hypothetical protein